MAPPESEGLKGTGVLKPRGTYVAVGGVGNGDASTHHVKEVALGDCGNASVVSATRFGYLDEFAFALLKRPDGNGVLSVQRTDAMHGWGQNLQVLLAPHCGLDKSVPVVSMVEGVLSPGGGGDSGAESLLHPLDTQVTGAARFFVDQGQMPECGLGLSLESPAVLRVRVGTPGGLQARIPFRILQNAPSWLALAERWVEVSAQPKSSAIAFDPVTSAVPDGVRANERNSRAILREWLNPSRALLPAFEAILEPCILPRALLAADPLGPALALFEGRLPDQELEQQLQASPHQYAVRALAERLGSSGAVFLQAFCALQASDAVHAAAFESLIAQSVEQCEARQRETFASVLEAAHEAEGGHGGAGISSLARAIRLKAHELKAMAFLREFIIPAEEFFRQREGRNSITVADVRVHGVNVYRSILHAALGVVTDRPAFLNDECKAACDFLGTQCSRPRHNLRFFRRLAGTSARHHCTGRRAFSGHRTAFDAGNWALGAGECAVNQLSPYLEAFVARLSGQHAARALVNTLLSDEHLGSVQTVIGKNDRLEALEFFWTPDGEVDVARLRAALAQITAVA